MTDGGRTECLQRMVQSADRADQNNGSSYTEGPAVNLGAPGVESYSQVFPENELVGCKATNRPVLYWSVNTLLH